MNNKELGLFILRLVIISHLVLTCKLPTSYLKMYNDVVGRAMFTLLILVNLYFDVINGLLLGLVLVFNNYEYLQRQKINHI